MQTQIKPNLGVLTRMALCQWDMVPIRILDAMGKEEEQEETGKRNPTAKSTEIFLGKTAWSSRTHASSSFENNMGLLLSSSGLCFRTKARDRRGIRVWTLKIFNKHLPRPIQSLVLTLQQHPCEKSSSRKFLLKTTIDPATCSSCF